MTIRSKPTHELGRLWNLLASEADQSVKGNLEAREAWKATESAAN
jgi:hypothetical protein